jgi:hypothetical protein
MSCCVAASVNEREIGGNVKPETDQQVDDKCAEKDIKKTRRNFIQ